MKILNLTVLTVLIEPYLLKVVLNDSGQSRQKVVKKYVLNHMQICGK